MSFGRRLAKDAGESWRKWPDTVLVEDQERPLVWVASAASEPVGDTVADAGMEGVLRRALVRERRRRRAFEILLVVLAAGFFVIGYAVGSADAAPRSTQLSTPVPSVAGSSGAPPSATTLDAGVGSAPHTEVGEPMLGGRASWFSTGRDGLYAAAGPALRVGDWRGAKALVCGPDGGCISVELVDWCQCHAGEPDERLIDLSDEAFRQLAPLDAGLVDVTVTVSGRG